MQSYETAGRSRQSKNCRGFEYRTSITNPVDKNVKPIPAHWATSGKWLKIGQITLISGLNFFAARKKVDIVSDYNAVYYFNTPFSICQ